MLQGFEAVEEGLRSNNSHTPTSACHAGHRCGPKRVLATMSAPPREIAGYLSEERPHIGYITQSIYVKPTTPPTAVALIIGNFDGKPGNKRDLKVYLTQTPDDELPRRSLQIIWASETA